MTNITGCVYVSDTAATITGTIINRDQVTESYLISAGGNGSFSIASGNVTVANLAPGQTAAWTVDATQGGGGLAPGPMTDCSVVDVQVSP